MNNIKDYIAYLYIVREKMRFEDKNNLWDYYCPRVKSTNEEITRWENQNGMVLPESYKAFLLAANGWPKVFQDKDLFGLEQLSFSKENKYIQYLSYCVDNLYDVGNKECLLPIGGTEYSYDLYLIILDKKSDHYGQVLWVAGEEVERYNDFNSFFESLIAYNKYNYELLTGKPYID
jgi:hypothetical protein